MKMILSVAILVFQGAAQTFTEPPLLLQLQRRTGVDLSIPSRYADARATVHVLGLTSVTGPPETWLVEAHHSFASVEYLSEAMRQGEAGRDGSEMLSGEILGGARSLIAVYRPDLSYRPDLAIRQFAKSRYFQIYLHRIRPGAGAAFGDMLRSRKDAYDSVNLDRPDIVYQAISGVPSGTFVSLAPLVSLKALDESMASRPNVREASGAKGAADIELSRGSLLFRVDPRLSYVSDDFAAEAPDFWKPKARTQ